MAFYHLGGPFSLSNFGHTFDYVAMILELCANFQLSSMVKSASRAQSYLEDVDGSSLEFWKIGSSPI